MKELVTKIGVTTAKNIQAKLIETPKSMFTMGRAAIKDKISSTIQNEIKSAKSFTGMIKPALKGGALAGTVYGFYEGIQGRIQDKNSDISEKTENIETSIKSNEQVTKFSAQDAKELETAIDKAVPSIKRAFDRFSEDTAKAASEVINKWEKKIEETDPKKVGHSDGIRVDKAPITTGIVAGVTRITDNKYVAAAPSIALDLLFSSGPFFVAGTAFRATSNATEVLVKHGPEIVQQIGNMAIEAVQKVAEDRTHMQDVIRENKNTLKEVHDTIETSKSKEKEAPTPPSHNKTPDSGRSI